MLFLQELSGGETTLKKEKVSGVRIGANRGYDGVRLLIQLALQSGPTAAISSKGDSRIFTAPLLLKVYRNHRLYQ